MNNTSMDRKNKVRKVNLDDQLYIPNMAPTFFYVRQSGQKERESLERKLRASIEGSVDPHQLKS